jgi:hypothetical protein
LSEPPAELVRRHVPLVELERILEEKPGLNETEVIRVGKTAAVRSGDFVQIQIQDPPSGPFVT